MNNFSNIKHKLESFLIISLPILMVVSRFMLELSLLIISISFLVKIIKQKNYFIFKNNFVYLFLFFYSILLLSFLFSDVKINILSILLYFRFGLYVMALYYFLNEDHKIVNYFLNTIVIIILIFFIDSLIQYYFGTNLIGLNNIEPHRITSFFGEEQVMGAYVVRLFPFLLLLKNIKEESSKSQVYLIYFAISASPVLMFLSGERVAMVLFFLMMSYYLIFFIRLKKFRFLYFYISLCVLVLSIFLYSSNIYFDRYITQTYQSIFDKNYSQNKHFLPKKYQEIDFYFLSAQHQNFIYTGMNIFKKNKFLGTGPKSYRYVCDNKEYKIVDVLGCNTHPHNYYIQFLIETGLVGLIFLILTYLYIIYRSCFNFIKLLKNQYFDSSEVIILGFYFTQLWPIMQHGSFFNNWNSIGLFLPMAFLLYFKKKPSFTNKN
ncbi:O-antigen ligase family protein [Candidatus Pelagibacter sp.]|nr:O-antigen ligase family protein [Candidatus Pelagibacter sp.]